MPRLQLCPVFSSSLGASAPALLRPFPSLRSIGAKTSVDLRGFGAFATANTLVLINGRRLMTGDPNTTTSAADLNFIPAALVKRVAAGRTVLMVEHNLKVVEGLCDRITVLTRGQVLAQGHYSELTKDERVKEAYLGAGHA